MFNRFPGRKIEVERVLLFPLCPPVPFPPCPLDGKVAAAAGSEQEGKANQGDRLDALQGGSHHRSHVVPYPAGSGCVRSRLFDIVVPFDAALHAAATGRTRARSPDKAFREAPDEAAERAIEGSSPATNPWTAPGRAPPPAQ